MATDNLVVPKTQSSLFLHKTKPLSLFPTNLHFPHSTPKLHTLNLLRAVSPTPTVTPQEPNLAGNGGGSGGTGGDGGGGDGFGGSGGGGGGGDEGEESGDEKKEIKMSMSQKITLAYAALVGLGGLIGFLKSGSQTSLVSGGLSAALLYYVYTQLPTKPVLASFLGLGLAASLLVVMGSRFKNSKKVFPAGIVSFVSLIMTGKLADVVLGFDTLEPYLKGEAPYFGCIVGRVANRIKEGKFTLEGVEVSLPVNKPPNHLHGGHKGFDKQVWEVAEYKKEEPNPSVTFKYYSPDGEEGYPGAVSVTAKYTLTSSTTMRLDMEAVPENKPTPINLAQHTYWNLAGHDSGSILDHTAQIWANHITPVDQNTIPTGELLPVKRTPFDFTGEKKIGTSINEVGLGYDHNYVLDCGEEKLGLKHAVKLKDPTSSRVLNLWTNAPGMQFYTANYVNDIVGKGGAVYNKHAAVCLETQGFPNAVNQPKFPSVIVRPGKKYKHTMLYEFSVE